MGIADDKSLILVILICCSTIVSIVGLILGAVSLSQKGAAQYNIYTQTASSPSTDSDKIWMIAIGHYDNNVEYLDPVTYTIKGYNVDVVDAVCDIANKNCELVNDIYENCWDSEPGQRPRGGIGLMGGWYDVCTGWVQTHDRHLTYAFTRPFVKESFISFFVKNETTGFDYHDLSTSTVGFLGGSFVDAICLERYSRDVTDPITGAALPADQIVHYVTADDLVQGVASGEVDAAFAPTFPEFTSLLTRVTDDTFPNYCVIAGSSMMTTKKNQDFIRWWDDAFNRLLPTKRYDDICQNIKREHAGIPGDDPKHICIGY